MYFTFAKLNNENRSLGGWFAAGGGCTTGAAGPPGGSCAAPSALPSPSAIIGSDAISGL
jgi:hypothetical protein